MRLINNFQYAYNRSELVKDNKDLVLLDKKVFQIS